MKSLHMESVGLHMPCEGIPFSRLMNGVWPCERPSFARCFMAFGRLVHGLQAIGLPSMAERGCIAQANGHKKGEARLLLLACKDNVFARLFQIPDQTI